MSRKRNIIKAFFVILIIVANIYVFFNIRYDVRKSTNVTLNINVKAEKNFDLQLYYSRDGFFSDNQLQIKKYGAEKSDEKFEYEIFLNTPYIRLDFGDSQNNIEISNIYYECKFGRKDIDIKEISNNKNTNDISVMDINDNAVAVSAVENDPYMVLQLDFSDFENSVETQNRKISIILDIVICLIIDLAALLIFKS